MANNRTCRYAVSPDVHYSQGYNLVLRKNGEYNELIKDKFVSMTHFNHLPFLFRVPLFVRLMQIYSALLLAYINSSKYTINLDICFKPEKKSARKLEKIKLKDLSGAFLLLGVGAVSSFVIFLAENIAGLIQRNRMKTPVHNA